MIAKEIFKPKFFQIFANFDLDTITIYLLHYRYWNSENSYLVQDRVLIKYSGVPTDLTSSQPRIHLYFTQCPQKSVFTFWTYYKKVFNIAIWYIIKIRYKSILTFRNYKLGKVIAFIVSLKDLEEFWVSKHHSCIQINIYPQKLWKKRKAIFRKYMKIHRPNT